jgi:mannose-6-phosphate isomerase-like protein (cupin superfamily)
MTFFHKNIEKSTISNNFYRKVLYTHKNEKNNGMQFVLMSLKPGVEIGMEIHKDHDQFIKIEKGKGKAIIKKGHILKSYKLYDGIGIIIPSGTYHNIINTGKDNLKIYTIYTPPEHKQYLVQKEKEKEKEKETKTKTKTSLQKGGELNSISYKEKYLKYKKKYLEIKNKK